MNIFIVNTNSYKLVSHLKDAIKAKKQNDFAGVDTDKLRLWKVEIPGDYANHLSNLTLDSDKLVVIKKISKYFSDSPSEEHIHVIVEPPVLSATSSEVLN